MIIDFYSRGIYLDWMGSTAESRENVEQVPKGLINKKMKPVK